MEREREATRPARQATPFQAQGSESESRHESSAPFGSDETANLRARRARPSVLSDFTVGAMAAVRRNKIRRVVESSIVVYSVSFFDLKFLLIFFLRGRFSFVFLKTSHGCNELLQNARRDERVATGKVERRQGNCDSGRKSQVWVEMTNIA